jgi:hypothetical protein
LPYVQLLYKRKSEDFNSQSIQKPPLRKNSNTANPPSKPGSAIKLSKEFNVEGVEEALASKNESLKDKKIKELSQKNKNLFVALEKEKGL